MASEKKVMEIPWKLSIKADPVALNQFNLCMEAAKLDYERLSAWKSQAKWYQVMLKPNPEGKYESDQKSCFEAMALSSKYELIQTHQIMF